MKCKVIECNKRKIQYWNIYGYCEEHAKSRRYYDILKFREEERKEKEE